MGRICTKVFFNRFCDSTGLVEARIRIFLVGIQFTYFKIYAFLSVQFGGFRIFTKLCSHQHNRTPRHSRHPEQEAHARYRSPPAPLSRQPLATTRRFQFSSTYPGVELLRSTAVWRPAFWGTATRFSSAVAPFPIPTSDIRGFHIRSILANTCSCLPLWCQSPWWAWTGVERRPWLALSC